MRILISNDDGYRAPGMAALVQACQGLRCSQPVHIDVVAPEQNASGTSNALTLTRPLSVFRAHLPAWGAEPAQAAEGQTLAYVVNGTPADSVHLALTGLLETTPDLIVSGINQGENMAEDTLYSGTVAAAMEGYLFGVPAVAFSLQGKGWVHLQEAVLAVRRVLQQIIDQWEAVQGQAWLLNVNMPAQANLPQTPVRLTRLGKRHASAPCVAQMSPRGETIYWIGPAGAIKDGVQGTDFHAVEQGCISVTPLQSDLTLSALREDVDTGYAVLPVWRSLWAASGA